MPDPKLTASEQEAIRWWVARHGGHWSRADEARLAAWLAASEENRQAHARVARVWSVAGDRAPAPAGPRSMPAGRRRAALAGLLLAVLVPFVAWEAGRWWQGTPLTVATGRGEFKTVTLADGSVMHLDADSEAVVRVGRRGRGAELRRGAALFVVRHDEARPFAVDAGGGRITDLGTEFAVERRAARVEVEVFEGRVALSTAGGTRELAAGQGAGYADDGAISPTFALAGTAPDWRQGRLVFRAEPLGEALARVARYHPVRFAIADPALAGLRLSGVFPIGDLAGFLRTLEAGLGLRAVRGQDGQITLHRAAS